MPTCPDCGSMIMEGDPYCPHCGAHLQWNTEETYETPESDDIFDYIYIDEAQKALLKAKVDEFMSIDSCTGLEVRQGRGAYIFDFTCRNRYIWTSHEFEFDPEYINPTRVFRDSISYTNHDNLRKDKKFQDMLSQTGGELWTISGGFVCEYTVWPDEFHLTDNIDIRVHVKLNGKIRMYQLDLDNMKLSDSYSEYELE